MVLSKLFIPFCLVFAVLTIIVFYFAGIWWGIGAGLVSVALIVMAVLYNEYLKQLDVLFKPF